jgi:hypothetical protein
MREEIALGGAGTDQRTCTRWPPQCPQRRLAGLTAPKDSWCGPDRPVDLSPMYRCLRDAQPLGPYSECEPPQRGRAAALTEGRS